MKIAVVYWSGTGNTEQMAEFVKEGAAGAGAAVDLCEVSAFSPDSVSGYDAIAFGCPSMGTEQLEEDEFAPVFEDCKASLSGKKIALFGSYGWGDGEWMRNWEDDCTSCGASLVCDSVICNDAPDDEAQAACKALGAALAS